MEHGYIYIYLCVCSYDVYIYIYTYAPCMEYLPTWTPRLVNIPYIPYMEHIPYIMKYPICTHFIPCHKLTPTLSALTASNSRRIRWLSMPATSACCLEHQISGWGEPERQNVPFSPWNKGVLQFFWVKQLWDCCTNMCTYVHSDQALPSACDPK